MITADSLKLQSSCRNEERNEQTENDLQLSPYDMERRNPEAIVVNHSTMHDHALYLLCMFHLSAEPPCSLPIQIIFGTFDNPIDLISFSKSHVGRSSGFSLDGGS